MWAALPAPLVTLVASVLVEGEEDLRTVARLLSPLDLTCRHWRSALLEVPLWVHCTLAAPSEKTAAWLSARQNIQASGAQLFVYPVPACGDGSPGDHLLTIQWDWS